MQSISNAKRPKSNRHRETNEHYRKKKKYKGLFHTPTIILYVLSLKFLYFINKLYIVFQWMIFFLSFL